jgi:hypothetical protein
MLAAAAADPWRCSRAPEGALQGEEGVRCWSSWEAGPARVHLETEARVTEVHVTEVHVTGAHATEEPR